MEKLLVFFRRREERNWCQQSFNQRVYAQNSMRKEGRGSPTRRWLPPFRDHPESQGPSCVSPAGSSTESSDREKEAPNSTGRKEGEEEEA